MTESKTESKVYKNPSFLIVSGTFLVMMMGVSMIVPAFPQIAKSLGVSEQSVGLLITMSTLPSFILTPVAGVMADRIGRKRLLVPSLIFFGVFGTACAFVNSFNWLLVLRVLQGIAGTPLGAVSGAVIGDLFHGPKRAEAMGLNTTIGYVGYIIYPVIGGALADVAWNYTFLPFALSIPLGFVAWACLRAPEPEKKQKLGEYLKEAVLYLRSLKVLWIFTALVLTYVLLYGTYLTYFSIFLSSNFEASSFTIGLFISGVGLITAIASSQVGRLSRRFSVVSLIIFSFVVYAVAVAIIPLATGLWLCVLVTILFGIAHGLNLPSQQVIAAGVAPMEHRAGFMSVNSMMLFLGMTIGPVVMGLAFSHTGLNNTFFIAGGIALIIPVMAAIIGKKKLTAEGRN